MNKPGYASAPDLDFIDVLLFEKNRLERVVASMNSKLKLIDELIEEEISKEGANEQIGAN